MQNMQLPEDFIRETKQLMGAERFSRYMEAFDEEAPVSIRLNPQTLGDGSSLFDNNSASMSQTKKNRPQMFEQVPWCKEGYYLEGRPQFTFDPLFHAGCYYVQEAASMFVTHVLRSLFPDLSACVPSETSDQRPGALFTLDLCAAPGGKSTAMRSVLPADSILVSNEPIANRAQILLENITKWGWPNCIVTNSYPKDFRKAKTQYDVILCDVPCSGEGMFRKDPATIGEWSLQNVEKCWRLQREIVDDAWACLKPGGLLIYGTCTFNIKENEENVRWIRDTFDAEILEIPTDPSWHITGSLLAGFDAPVYRFIPGITRSEGLFMAVLRKKCNSGPGPSIKNFTSGPDPRGKKCNLGPGPSIKILQAETAEGEFPKVETDYQEALRYLRGEALVLPPETPRGIVTVTYKGFALGPAKNIGNRANNLYPKAWRIKTTHLPAEPVEIINLQTVK
jgi:16S rRNA C967 or C1407 C5-methylase (RsmB/RsmF family)